MMYTVIAELRNEDRRGRGAKLEEALATVGPLPKSVIRVYITRRDPSGHTVKAEGESLLVAMVRFIEALGGGGDEGGGIEGHED